jgi:SagB-type dehydrogenase family enzyme
MKQEIFSVMRNRRSERRFAATPITKQQLADCIFAGVGITGFVTVPVMGQLPLKMTPSGGARNPYEAFVYVRNVRSLARGIYHYSSLENSLGLVNSKRLSQPRYMLGNQDWANDAAAIIFLVAHFERTMWKYSTPNAYRVVLIEAGHIGQNIALAATALGLASAPTCAIHDSIVEKNLQLHSITQSVVYALAVGRPGS